MASLLTSILLLFVVAAACYQQVQQQQQQSLFQNPNPYFSPAFATASGNSYLNSLNNLNSLNFQNFPNQITPVTPQPHQHNQNQNFNPGSGAYNGYFYPPLFPSPLGQQPFNPNPYFPTQPHPQPFPAPTPAPPQIPNIFQGFQLPRQVRVPGKIEINILGNDAEIICEFPRYLLLVQRLHWHFRYDDPYGTFYDSSNNFAPRVTVATLNKYKSILQIRNFNEDDFGNYRCISAAILPNEADNENYSYPRPDFLRISGAASSTTEVTKRIKKRSFYPTTFKPAPALFAPFYKPSYGLFGVFQEIKFTPGSRVSFLGNRLANIKASPGEESSMQNNNTNSNKIFGNKI